jgi:hypothetical protein
MTITIYRASELFNHPAVKARRGRKGKSGRTAKPARKGLFPVSRSYFYEVIEPRLQRVELGEKAVGYTGVSVTRLMEKGIPRKSPSENELESGAPRLSRPAGLPAAEQEATRR